MAFRNMVWSGDAARDAAGQFGTAAWRWKTLSRSSKRWKAKCAADWLRMKLVADRSLRRWCCGADWYEAVSCAYAPRTAGFRLQLHHPFGAH